MAGGATKVENKLVMIDPGKINVQYILNVQADAGFKVVTVLPAGDKSLWLFFTKETPAGTP